MVILARIIAVVGHKGKAREDASDLSIQEIVPGVHAALGGICNRGLISQGGSVLVVDSGIARGRSSSFTCCALPHRNVRKTGRCTFLIRIPIAIMCMGTRYLRIVLSSRTKVYGIILVAHGEGALARWRQNPRYGSIGKRCGHYSSHADLPGSDDPVHW